MTTATIPRHADHPAPGSTPRSDAYALLSLAYSFPEASLLARVRDGRWDQDLAAVLCGLPYRINCAGLNWSIRGGIEDVQTEYIRLFQIGGRRGPPCPLHGGHYGIDRAQELRRLISFYNYFGFRVTECAMPDHIAVQLEFMSELVRGVEIDNDSSLRAQRDFLNRLAWCEGLGDRLRAARPAPFYRSLAEFSRRLISLDRRYVNQAVTGG